MTSHTRPRGSLKGSRRVNIILEGHADARLDDVARAAQTSRSAVVQWLLERAELDETGVPLDWNQDHPREELLPINVA